MGTKPLLSWPELKELYDDQGPLSIEHLVRQHDSRRYFSSIEDALVKVSVALCVEQKWEQKMFRELCKGEFDAAFFLLGPATAVACVRRKDPRIS
jgi:hypothetical protein